MSKPYSPRAGSIPSRVMAYLAENGSAKTQDLSSALEVSANGLHNNCDKAVKFGLIQKEIEEGEAIWSLGEGAADQPESGDADLDQEQSQEPFTAGLFSDGELCLMNAGRAGDTELILTKEQTRTLVNYLFRFEYSDQAQDLIPAAKEQAE